MREKTHFINSGSSDSYATSTSLDTRVEPNSPKAVMERFKQGT